MNPYSEADSLIIAALTSGFDADALDVGAACILSPGEKSAKFFEFCEAQSNQADSIDTSLAGKTVGVETSVETLVMVYISRICSSIVKSCRKC